MAKRRMGIITVLFCFYLCWMPGYAQAASISDAVEPISPEHECTLTLSYLANGDTCSDLPVKLYQIAKISADFQYTLSAPFTASGLILNGIQSTGEWNVVRTTLESYILSNHIEATAMVTTDSAGQARFESLVPGLYLAVPNRVSQDHSRYSFDSALVSLPDLDTNGLWQYEVTVASKSGFTPPPDPDPTPDPGPTPDPDPKPDPKPDPTPEIQYKVLKLWKGESDQTVRPQAIEVEIFCDETSYQTVILSEDNHWSFAWTAKDDGSTWMVAERDVPSGYTVTVEKRETAFVLTNTLHPDIPPTEEETPPNTPGTEEQPPEFIIPDDGTPKDHLLVSPETGDTPHILLYTILMYVSGTLLILLGFTGKRRRV